MTNMIYNDQNWELLLADSPERVFGELGAFPRQTVCGSPEAERMGLIYALDEVTPVPEGDWKDCIAECHAKKLFPMYHRADSPLPQKPTQNGLNYCWAWGIVAAIENCRLLEGQTPVKLAPTSLGWTVNWRNAGNYLESAMSGARNKGVCSVEFVPNEHEINPRAFREGWEADALNYRTSEWWDLDRSRGTEAMIAQCLAVLRTGRTLYIAYNWWGHALTCVGLEWDETQVNNIVWVDFNSHGDGIKRLAGSKGVPDEAYGIRATSLPKKDS